MIIEEGPQGGVRKHGRTVAPTRESVLEGTCARAAGPPSCPSWLKAHHTGIRKLCRQDLHPARQDCPEDPDVYFGGGFSGADVVQLRHCGFPGHVIDERPGERIESWSPIRHVFANVQRTDSPAAPLAMDGESAERRAFAPRSIAPTGFIDCAGDDDDCHKQQYP
jgi:hypothetical protein